MSRKGSTGTVAVVILAAGKGTRMKSDKAKVLHRLAGRPMILYVVDAAASVAGNAVVVVVGTEAQKVREVVAAHGDVLFAYQEHQLGTGHAVICALPSLPDTAKHIIVLCGDVSLIRSETLHHLLDSHRRGQAAVTVLGAEVEDPRGYGRLKRDDQGRVERIVEEADATDAERTINIVNTGIYCVNRDFLEEALFQITSDNVQNEIYLTDIIAIAADQGKGVGLVLCPESNQMLGVNTIHELEAVEGILARQ